MMVISFDWMVRSDGYTGNKKYVNWWSYHKKPNIYSAYRCIGEEVISPMIAARRNRIFPWNVTVENQACGRRKCRWQPGCLI
jgi:hypothetical protein